MSAVFVREENILYIHADELCQFVLRAGSLDPSIGMGAKSGVSIVSHKMWNEKPNMDVYRGACCEIDGINTTIYANSGSVTPHNGEIEKLIAVDFPLDRIDDGLLELTQNQAMLAAYIACERENLNEIKIKLTFERSGTDEERTISAVCTRSELKDLFELAVALFTPYAAILKQKATDVPDQLNSLKFPFEGGAREGQRDFIYDVARAIKTGKRLIVQAPTGTGKTMASIYPTLKAMGKGSADKLFYLTGKTTTAISALNAIDLLREQLPDLRVIHISAKDKCCVTYGQRAVKRCDPRHCAVTRDYFEKINVAILDLLENYRTYTKDVIDEVAARYGICSYELSLELSEWSEVVICDYNYLFDLQAYLKRYFEIPPEARFVFLIDEAHNLPDRAREMYSCTLTREQFESIASRFPSREDYSEICAKILSEFDELKEMALSEKVEMDGDVYGFYINSEPPSSACELISAFATIAKRVLNKLDDDEVHAVFLDARKLTKIMEIYDKHFTSYVEVKNDEVKLRIMCLDPSFMLNRCMQNGISSILFSATLSPMDYFTDVLGCARAASLSLPSPFDSDNQCLICINNISTRYSDRSSSANSIASIIRAMIEGKSGNYIVYFPSYRYLTDVMEVFTKRFPNIAVTAQSRSMSEKAKADFLDSFNDKKGDTLVGFCVMGGSFSEGIDLRGERLIGAMIVGVGLPTISTELNIIKEHYDKTRENGYAYVYTYPGMIKVTQAAGRVIRSDDERGVVLLVDDRFDTPDYRDIMPEYWSHMKYMNNAKDLLRTIVDFWKK